MDVLRVFAGLFIIYGIGRIFFELMFYVQHQEVDLPHTFLQIAVPHGFLHIVGGVVLIALDKIVVTLEEIRDYSKNFSKANGEE